MASPPPAHDEVDGGFIPVEIPEKEELNMDARLYVGNLSKVTTQDELKTLFAQAGDITATDVIKDRRTGESKGFAFITMGSQSEADQAISMFNAYSLHDQDLKVSMAKAKEQQVVTSQS